MNDDNRLHNPFIARVNIYNNIVEDLDISLLMQELLVFESTGNKQHSEFFKDLFDTYEEICYNLTVNELNYYSQFIDENSEPYYEVDDTEMYVFIIDDYCACYVKYKDDACLYVSEDAIKIVMQDLASECIDYIAEKIG